MEKKTFPHGLAVFAVLLLAGTAFASDCASDYKSVWAMDVYDASGVVDAGAGSVSVWAQLLPDYPGRRDHVIFHTDDSRYVLGFDTYTSGIGDTVVRVFARAGGNHRAVDSGYAAGNFPEASIIIDNGKLGSGYNNANGWFSKAEFPESQWHLLTMTWNGYPSGKVAIYLDGKKIGEKPYSNIYDDKRPMFKEFAVGYREPDWTGEITVLGSQIWEGKPKTAMSLERGGIEVKDLRIYRCALSEDEIASLAGAGTDAKIIPWKVVETPSAGSLKLKNQLTDVSIPIEPPLQTAASLDGDRIQIRQGGKVIASSENRLNDLPALLGNNENMRKIAIEVDSGSMIYDVKSVKKLNFLGLMPIDMEVSKKVDAATARLISEEKPWWGEIAEAFSN